MSNTLTQSKSSTQTATSGTNQNLAFTSACAAGDLIIVCINFGNNVAGIVYAVTDSAAGGSNTYTAFPHVATTTTQANDLTAFWAIAKAAETLTISAKQTGGGSHTMRLAIYDYNSTTGWNSSPVDVGNSNVTTSTGVTATAGSITPAASGELLFSAIQFSVAPTSGTIAATAPFSEQPAGGTAGNGWASSTRADGAHNLNSGNTSTTCTWTWTGALTISAFICAFKPATTGNVTVALTGNSMTASAGTLSESGDANLTLSGSSMSSSAGNLSPAGGASVALTGSSLAATAAILGISGSANVPLTGSSITSSAGNLSITGSANVALVGSSLSIAPGTLTVSIGGSITVALTGQAMTSTAGNLGVIGDANVSLTGSAIVSTAGTITITVPGAVSVHYIPIFRRRRR